VSAISRTQIQYTDATGTGQYVIVHLDKKRAASGGHCWSRSWQQGRASRGEI